VRNGGRRKPGRKCASNNGRGEILCDVWKSAFACNPLTPYGFVAHLVSGIEAWSALWSRSLESKIDSHACFPSRIIFQQSFASASFYSLFWMTNGRKTRTDHWPCCGPSALSTWLSSKMPNTHRCSSEDWLQREKLLGLPEIIKF